MQHKQNVNLLARVYDEEAAILEEAWHLIYLRTILIATLVIITAEACFAFLLPQVVISQMNPKAYYTKYLLIPIAVFFFLDILTYSVYHFNWFKGKAKQWVLSLCLALVALAICFFHDYFIVTFAACTTAILMTIGYGSQQLTLGITLFIIAMQALIAFLGLWDTSFVRDSHYAANVGIAIALNIAVYLMCRILAYWSNKLRNALVLHQFEIQHLQKTAVRDQLTGIRNSLGLAQYVSEQETGNIYAMLDIDNFKQVNDKFSRDEGDNLLRGLAQILLAMETNFITAFRFGGDEFLLAFIDHRESDVRNICTQVKSRFEDLLSPELKAMNISLTFGVSEANKLSEQDEAIRQAGAALSAARAEKKMAALKINEQEAG